MKSYEKPVQPTGLRAVHRESEILLFWAFPKDKEPSITGFYLTKSADAFEKIVLLENHERSYTDRDFKTGREYSYKLVSESLKGVMSATSNIIKIKPESAPLPPGHLSFSTEYDSLTLKWESAGQGILYNVYKKDETGAYPLAPLNAEPLRETLFKDTLDLKKSVYYTVRSLRGGAIRDEGPASEEIGIAPAEFVPSAPEGLQTVVTEENVYLIWKETPQTWTTGYRIYRQINKDEGFVLIGESLTPSFVDKDRPATKRNYRVTALGPSKEGTPAEIRDIVYESPR